MAGGSEGRKEQREYEEGSVDSHTDLPCAACDKNRNFKEDLTRLINKYSLENTSNTPDYIIANYLVSCLEAFNIGVNQRGKWYRT